MNKLYVTQILEMDFSPLLNYKTKTVKELKEYINNDGFCWTCKNGHFQLAQWLLSIKPDIGISSHNDYSFAKACENGHFQLAQWLLSIKPDINISARGDYSFAKACENGHFQLAQWLLLIKPDIDISAHDDFSFTGACENGHLEIAQWLLLNKPDINISTHDDYSFAKACENGHLSLAQWLCTLVNRYQITQRGNLIIDYKILKKIKTVKTIKVKNKEECCVCYEISDIQTDCGHYGCQKCFNQLNNNKCPYCRTKIKKYYKIEY